MATGASSLLIRPLIIGYIISKAGWDFWNSHDGGYRDKLKTARHSILFWSNHRDSDDEWETWTFVYRDVYLLALAMHVVLSQFLPRLLPGQAGADVITPYRVRMFYCLFFMFLFFDWTTNFLVLFYVVLGYVITIGTCIALPELDTMPAQGVFQIADFLNYAYLGVSIFFVATSDQDPISQSVQMCSIFRTASYCFEFVVHKRKEARFRASQPAEPTTETIEKPDGGVKLIIGNLHGTLSGNFEKLCFYNFYLPTLVLGPIVPYSDITPISRQRNDVYEKFGQRVKDEGWKLVKLLGYVAVVEVLLHHFPLFTLANHDWQVTKVTPELSSLVLYLMLLFDWFKAYIIYEISGSLLTLDGFKSLDAPVPLTNLYLFADTFFDRNIHYWLVRYVYDPLACGSHDPIFKNLPSEDDDETFKPTKNELTGVELKSNALALAKEQVKQENAAKASCYNETKAAGISFLIVALSAGMGFDIIVFAVANWVGLSFEYYARRNLKTGVEKGGCMVYGLHKLQVLTAFNLIGILFFNMIGFVGFRTTVLFGINIFSSVSGIITLLSICYLHVQRISK